MNEMRQAVIANIGRTLESIRTTLEAGEVAYVYANGEWEIGNAESQPANTFVVGCEDFELFSMKVLVGNLRTWVEGE